MRRCPAGSLLVLLSVLIIFSSSLMKNPASALSGTGVGIRLDGPLSGFKGEKIVYGITVFNLGDFWIRNVTVTDRFPNGTSLSWEMSDLAPLGQLGDRVEISGIIYVIQDADVDTPENPPYIVNHAEVIGFSDVQGQMVPVGAEADHLLFITERPAGGYSVTVKITASPTPTAIYLTLLFVITVAFLVFRCNTAFAHRGGETSRKVRVSTLFSSHTRQ